MRFDGARYRDFVAELVIKLRPVSERAPDDPFVSLSHSGTIGLAFRLQERADAAAAWGGGYLAVLTVDKDELPVVATLQRFAGLSIPPRNFFAVAPLAPCELAREPALEKRVPRSALFAPEGFRLQVRAVASRLTMSVNEQAVLETDDPAGFADGRIALFTSRLIATFESLNVAPLRPEVAGAVAASAGGHEQRRRRARTRRGGAFLRRAP